MRISDWSSDVCSSDLAAQGFRQLDAHLIRIGIPSVVHQFLRGTLGRSVFLTQQRGETGINLESKICGTLGWLLLRRSEERRVATGCVSMCQSLWLPYR